MRALFASALAISVQANPAFAIEVRDCDWTAGAQMIAEPWDQNTKTFDNGNIRVALLDTGGEPVCCSAHLLILAADESGETGGRACRVISNAKTMGYESIDFARLRIDHARARGVSVVTFPYTLYIDGIRHRSGVGRVFVNTTNGKISTR